MSLEPLLKSKAIYWQKLQNQARYRAEWIALSAEKSSKQNNWNVWCQQNVIKLNSHTVSSVSKYQKQVFALMAVYFTTQTHWLQKKTPMLRFMQNYFQGYQTFVFFCILVKSCQCNIFPGFHSALIIAKNPGMRTSYVILNPLWEAVRSFWETQILYDLKPFVGGCAQFLGNTNLILY